MNPTFPELQELETLVPRAERWAKIRVEADITCRERRFSLYSFRFGTAPPDAPMVAFVAGIHGLERIGTGVLLSFLRSFITLLEWDKVVHDLLARCNVLFVPIANPGGMYLHMRSNPQGIDLMRNAPVDAEGVKSRSLFAGHRISPRLPWFRGAEGAPMALEARTLCDIVRRELFPARAAISLDIHSGFGTVDRLWFPYARTKRPFPALAEAFLLKRLLDATYPHHVYVVEPQSLQYLAHGDLWDYLYDEYSTSQHGKAFLPLSLEMGSWLWVKKNPKQLFSILGIFNPMLPHRRTRTMRRHLLLFDFLLRAAIGHDKWAVGTERPGLENEALSLWYTGKHRRALTP